MAASKFACMLDRMLTGFNRSEWAAILNVKEHTIDAWCEDRVFPFPETLRRLTKTLYEMSSVPDSLIEEFEALSREPLHSITFFKITGRTLEEYMLGPVRQAFESVLRTVPAHAQEQVLLEAAALARQHREDTLEPVSVRRDRLRRVMP